MLILLAVSYILGSIPCSFVVTRLRFNIDIRNVGSGNAGATNVFRVDKKLALIVLLLDIAKSSVYLMACKMYGMEQSELCLLGLSAVVGHIFPLWLKFKGGKGVATTLGVIMIINPIVVALFVLVWASFFLIFRYPSLSSISALITAAIGVFWLESVETAGIFLCIAALVIAKHKSNVLRLLKGEEQRL